MKNGPLISILFPLLFSGTTGSAATHTLHLERPHAAAGRASLTAFEANAISSKRGL